MSLSPLVCAHRGRSGIFPENTLPAFEAAIELGADFIELDVRRTADGQIICLHDPTVDRTTDGSGELSSLTLAEVQALDAGSWKGGDHAGARIPLLREVLEQIAPRMVIHIEIKQRGIVEQVVEIVRETGTLRRVAIISFDEGDLRTAKAAEPAAACGLITGKPREEGPEGELALIASALSCGANFISCGHRAITPTLVRECHLIGLSLIAWTMDTPEDLRPMVDLGVDMLCSNFPERALEVLGR